MCKWISQTLLRNATSWNLKVSKYLPEFFGVLQMFFVVYYKLAFKELSTQAAYNLGHNILELCNNLVQIRLTTSRTKRYF